MQAAAFTGFTLGYQFAPMAKAAQDALVVGGSNVLAVHCHQTTGGQYIDVGLFSLGL